MTRRVERLLSSQNRRRIIRLALNRLDQQRRRDHLRSDEQRTILRAMWIRNPGAGAHFNQYPAPGRENFSRNSWVRELLSAWWHRLVGGQRRLAVSAASDSN